jgi:hypothetical protein
VAGYYSNQLKVIKLAGKKQRLQQIQGEWTAAEIIISEEQNKWETMFETATS